ncbi:exopolysaccharide biosynthesis polyprenyl glycosylphosphotransferase [Shewanella marinintestina]|uniref:exopolysaccharide biosynthesis polyprenyl glycosylphosphotransferase n=1 Tax=Shewanella marinintestina TaxID=190305 RepID=UPI00200FC14B|nr:exopolysaccharide biosynthesis polyprenyl glycosylphosphotransferase [Shewanella marinintestina]MCL1145194.1 exopolysaccharide biosynthesis polyprenyl glycosylphosphotransferase [Shewanella marinintestina]
MKNSAAYVTQSRLTIRSFELICGLLLMVVASPFMLFACLRSAFTAGPVIECVYIKGVNKQIISLYQFSYNGWFKKLPNIINLITGDIHIVGSQFRFSIITESAITPSTEQQSYPQKRAQMVPEVKPGILSIAQLNSLTGLTFEDSNQAINRAHSNLARYLLALVRIMTLNALFKLFFKSHPKHCATIAVFGITLNNWTMTQLLEEILFSCNSNGKNVPKQSTAFKGAMQQYAFVNADCLNISTANENYRQCLQQSQRVFADGIGVRVACLSKNQALLDNLNGTDMFPRLCQLAAEQQLSIYMLGGQSNVASIAAKNMQQRYPKLKIVGCHHGYFNTDATSKENLQVIDAINHSEADILLVAMGAPKQEMWLAENKAKLNCKVGIGVGGLFDFYAERVKRAPLWLRQMGLEWTYRLLQEPTRMWQRYIIGSPAFLYRVWRENRQLKQLSTKDSLTMSERSPSMSAQSEASEALQKIKLKKQYEKAARRAVTAPAFDGTRANARRALFDLNLRLSRTVKRCFDIMVSALLLALLLPVFLMTALLIKVTSRGPVLFKQPRAGLHNRPFNMWKFRSMYIDAEHRLTQLQESNEMADGVTFKMKSDPRITNIGRFIRKASIDELPQLWNVLKGDMSLVGPRPALASEVEQYSTHHRNRLAVKPGITCIWQVSGRSTIPFEQQVELDIEYIYRQSLMADIWLLLKTIPAVVFARGAY